MPKKVSFNFRGKKININAKECKRLNRFFGLMFKGEEEADALLFEFKKPVNFMIHSFFVFFPFIAIWLDEEGNVIEIKRIKPFTMSVRTKRPYKKLLEIPLNEKYKKKLNFSAHNSSRY